MGETWIPAALREVLDYSLREQAQVLVHVSDAKHEGVVSRLDDDVVELRSPSGRCLIRLDRVDAVLRE
ncbi:MAG: hypothetical protein ABR950_02470 [Candidatus Dormibacteria bacterium]|jgi:hypothetical protein